MARVTPDESWCERHFREVLAAYLEQLELGLAPDRAEWVRKHPEFATELQEFFADWDAVIPSVAPLRIAAARDVATDAAESRSTASIDPGDRGRQLPSAILPQAFGHYELLEELGHGGMAVVYRAHDHRLSRDVALKLASSSRWSDATDLKRFQQEAAAVARLDHPHIVPVYEVGEEAGICYFTMKLLTGGSLRQHLSQFAQRPREAARLMVPVAQALHHAHQRGILHRDLKPSNVLLDDLGQPYVSDFGLALQCDADHQLTRVGDLIGTPPYIAPEQISARPSGITIATDVYGLGAILYTLLAQRPPFAAESIGELLDQIRHEIPRSPRHWLPKLDSDLETICLTALQKDPELRYATADEMANDLLRYLDGEPIQARPARWYEIVRSRYRRHPHLGGSIIALTLAGVLLMTLLLAHNSRLRELNRQLDQSLRQSQALQQRAARSERASQQLLYISDMKLAEQAWLDGNVRRYYELLQRHVPRPQAADVRGFEWHYLRQFGPRSPPPITPHAAALLRDAKTAAQRLIDDAQDMLLLDSDRLLVASHRGLQLWDLAPLRPLSCWARGDFRHLAATADKQLLAAARRDGQILLFHHDGSLHSTLTRPGIHSASRILLSPRGDRLYASGTAEGEPLCCLHVPTGRPMEMPALIPGTVLAASPDGRYIAALDQPHLALHELSSTATSRRLEGHLAPPATTAFSPDSRILASAGPDRRVKLWRLEPPREISSRLARGGSIQSLAFSPDGRSLVSGTSDGSAIVWHAETGQELCGLPRLPAGCVQWQFASDQSYLLCRLADHSVWRIRLRAHVRS